MNRASHLALLSLITVTATGCSSLKESVDAEFAGSQPLFNAGEFEQLNLCNTLVQFRLASYQMNGALTAPDNAIKTITDTLQLKPDPRPEGVCLVSAANDVPAKIGRNNFVSYVMGKSDEVCGRYKADLLNDRAFTASTLGILTTLFAGVSSVVTHVNTASAFAAAAGFTSGTNAVISQERFSNLAVEIITSGIEQRRNSMETEIESKFDKNLVEYPVGSAIQDAMDYHATCSVVTGLEVAKDSISRVDDPGVKNFFRLQRELAEENAEPTEGSAEASLELAEDTPLTGIDVLAAEEKAAGAVLTLGNPPVLPLGAGEKPVGTAVVSSNSLNFVPAQDYFGTVSIQYTVTNSSGNAANRVVALNVTPVNDAPIVKDVPAEELKKGEEKIFSDLILKSQAADVDAGDNANLRIEKVALVEPSKGGTAEVVEQGTSIKFVAPDTSVVVGLRFTISDGNGGSASTLMQINVK